MGGLTGASEALPAAGLLLTLCAWLCKQLLLALTPLLAEPAVVGVVTEEPSVLARVGALDVMAVGAFLVLCRVRLRQDGPAAPVLQSSAAAGARGWHWTRRSTAPSPPPTSAGDASQVVYSPFRGLPKGSALPPPSTVADKLDDTVSVMDFIPRRLHAAIRQNLTVAQGNADVTQYVQAALDFVGCDTTKGGPVAPRALGSVHFPGGRYMISNLVLNASMKLAGEYLDNTTLMALPGTTGPMITDRGDAAKVSLQDLTVHGGDVPMVSAAIELGTKQGGGTSPWGTYAYLTNIYCRNVPRGCGVRLKVNVCTMSNACRCADNVWSGGTADGILNLNGGCALFAFGCGAAGFTRTGIMLQQSDYWSGVEVEAPAQGSTPVVLRGPATIDGMLISLTNDAPTHFDALIQVAMDGIDSTTAGWSVSGVTVIAARGYGTYDRLIAVGAQPKAQSVSGFSTASDLALEQWLRLGAGVAALKGGVGAVPCSSVFVDPGSGRLTFKDAKGATHALHS